MAGAPEAAQEVIQLVLDTLPEVVAILELLEQVVVPMARETEKNQWPGCPTVQVLEVLEVLAVQEEQVVHLACEARMDQGAKELGQEALEVLAVHREEVHVDQGHDDVQVAFHQEVHRVMAQVSVSLEQVLQKRVEQHPSLCVSPEAALFHQNHYRRGGQ